MLTAEEKILLREAIFDSEFEAEFGLISKTMLEAIDALSDDDVRVRLNLYIQKKESDRLAKIAELEAEINKLRGENNGD